MPLQLVDAKKQLVDAKKQLVDAKKQLVDAKKQLVDAKKQLVDVVAHNAFAKTSAPLVQCGVEKGKVVREMC